MVAKRIDSNQNEIVNCFRQNGVAVAITAPLGNGFPDLVVAINGINLLIEIKDGKKPPSARKLTEKEQKFHDSWTGHLFIVNSVDDCLELIKRFRNDSIKVTLTQVIDEIGMVSYRSEAWVEQR